jgi:hypothetical protein
MRFASVRQSEAAGRAIIDQELARAVVILSGLRRNPLTEERITRTEQLNARPETQEAPLH